MLLPMRAALVLLILTIGCKRDSAYVVHRASGPMTIDGVLAESAWDRAEKAAPFVRSLDGKPAAAATEARLLWDDDHLYVAFLCEDANVSGAFFKVVQTSQPDSSGIITSRRIRSGLVSSARSTPSRPLRATRTE